MRYDHLLLPLLSGVTFALRSGKHCFNGCDLTLAYVDFDDTDQALSRKIRTCRSALHAASLYLCVDVYCEVAGRQAWLAALNETCTATVDETVPPWSIVETYTSDDVAGLRRLRAEEGTWDSRSPPLSEVVIPDASFFERAFKTLDYAYFEVDIHLAYGLAMLWFWCIVVAFGICWRLLTLIQASRHLGWHLIPNDDCDAENLGDPKDHHRTGLPYALLKRYLIIPAAFGYRCSQHIGCGTVPPRIQSLAIFSFVLLNTLLCCISYPVFDGNLYWEAVSTQYWRYVSDRAGVIALANFPLIWLFGTRNNLLINLTGWSFSTYNNFHRWVARVSTVQAVVHSIGYTEMVFERGSWSLFMKYMRKFYFWNGEIATLLMCALCACSIYGLRRKHYEFFLITHIGLSGILLLSTFYHVSIFNGEWNIFIWPCLAFWLLDRALRALRILAFDRKFWNTKATATYDEASNLVRLEVPCGKTLLHARHGSFYYVYVLSDPIYMHQNHPLTLAYVSHGGNRNTQLTPPSPSNSSNRQCRHTSPRRTPSPEYESLLPQRPHLPTTAFPSPSSPSLVFLVRPYSGFTSRLCRSAIAQPRTLRVLIEGPYGAPMSPSTLSSFPSILFIAGGTGIAVAIAYLSTLLADADTSSSRPKVHIVWAIRSHQMLETVLAHDIPPEVLRDKRVRMTVHVTQDAELENDIVSHSHTRSLADEGLDIGSSTDSLARSKLAHDIHVTLKAGRPIVRTVVLEAAERMESHLAIVACGPAAMADDARRASVKLLEKGYRGVEYFEESFKW